MVLVIKMNNPNHIIVTDIQPPMIVQSKKGKQFRMTNRQSFGLSLCISGQITYEMNDKTYISTPATAVLLPQGSTYSLFGDKDGLFPVVNFTCSNFHCDEILVFPLKQAQSCMKSFETLKKLFQRNDLSLEIYSVFYDLLDKVFSTNTQKPQLLDFAVDYIEKNLQNAKLSNTILAEKMGISEVYLRKLFASHCGVSPKQYILEARIQKAKQLLVDTSFTVTTIAQDCGFSSVYHFCRAFKERTGVTPTHYAAKNITYNI